MASRYWVGGTNGWGGTAGSKWSNSSGGSGGSSVPDDNDTAYFDGNSGSGSVSINNAECRTLNATGFNGRFDDGSGELKVYGGSLHLDDTEFFAEMRIHSGSGGTIVDVYESGSGSTISHLSIMTTDPGHLRLQTDLTVGDIYCYFWRNS